ncbi:MAG TPA: hypothetical protein VFJ82_17105 [Longimicrobium sp.]|nr:hypothetical protein [Longimicrobium sp.]
MRIRILHASIALAALAGCRADRPQVPPRREPAAYTSVPTVDTVVRVTSASSTAGERRVDWRQPGDRCRYADARPQRAENEPGYGTRYDEGAMARGVALRCTLRDGGPELRLVVRGEDAIPTEALIYLPAAAKRPLQRVGLRDNDQTAFEGSTLAEGFDLNRDGWTDLKVQTWSGSAGVSYELFIYDPARRRFVQDSVLPGGGGLDTIAGRRQPCVSSFYASGADAFNEREYCWRRGHWVLIRERVQDHFGEVSDRRYVVTVRAPRGGTLVTVRVDTSATPPPRDPR